MSILIDALETRDLVRVELILYAAKFGNNFYSNKVKTERNENNESPLMVAIRKGYEEIALALIEMEDETLNYTNIYGFTPLMYTSHYNSCDTLKKSIVRKMETLSLSKNS
jgi:hypothetical protein